MRVAEEADYGSDLASQDALKSDRRQKGGCTMLGSLTQGRAKSLSDGGRAGGDTFRAQTCIRSRFVLNGRVVIGLAVAGALAISMAARVTIEGSMTFSRLVSPSTIGCAMRVAEEADYGSDLASQDALKSDTSKLTPKRLNPGTWGELA
jgi:hypothetical protein